MVSARADFDWGSTPSSQAAAPGLGAPAPFQLRSQTVVRFDCEARAARAARGVSDFVLFQPCASLFEITDFINYDDDK